LWNWDSRSRPDLEYLRPGSVVLGGSDAEMKELVDLIASGEEARPTVIWTAQRPGVEYGCLAELSNTTPSGPVR
jgi:hypothetical protein